MNEIIKNKVIVITGASSGIGESAARHLAQEGATVVLGARRTDRLQALANEIKKGGGNVLVQVTDVTQQDQVKALVDNAVNTFGRVDVIINNAGVMLLSKLEDLKVDEWQQMIDVNIKGVLYGIAAVLPHMKRQKSGHIINVASVAGHKIWPNSAVYGATKFAVRALSEGFRQEVKPYNIRTTIVSPGSVYTELLDHISGRDLAKSIHERIDKYALPPDSFARIVAFVINQPEEVDINEVLFRSVQQEV